MTTTTQPTTQPTTTTADARKRFSFGPVWNAAVLAGKITDHDKLVAHAVKLKVAARSDAKRLKFATLLVKVQTKLTAEAATPTAQPAVTAAE